MTVNVYLNELSLDVPNSDGWAIPFDNAISCLKVLSNIDPNRCPISTIINRQFFLTIAIPPDTKFTDLLNRDKERKKSFLDIYKRAIQELLFVDSTAKYRINDKDVSNTTVADAYESQKLEFITILINLNPNFPSPIVNIQKEYDGNQDFMSYHVVESLIKQLQRLDLLKDYYDISSKVRPNDSQTILSDTSLFVPTKYGNRKARLYRRIGKEDELWCLDRFHRGRSIHLEVFSESSRKQIAVSCHDKIDFFRDLTREERKRTLVIEPMP